MNYETNNMERNPDVDFFLRNKIGFFLSKGNLLILIMILIGVFCSRMIEYPELKLIEVTLKYSQPFDKGMNEIEIGTTNNLKDIIKAGNTLFFRSDTGLIQPIGTIQRKVFESSDSIFYKIHLKERFNFIKKNKFSDNKEVFIQTGNTNFFDDFIGQFAQGTKHSTGLNQIDLRKTE